MEYSVKQEKPSTVVVEGFFYVRAVGFGVHPGAEDVCEPVSDGLDFPAGKSLDASEATVINLVITAADPYAFMLELDRGDVAKGQDGAIVATVFTDERHEEITEGIDVISHLHKVQVVADRKDVFYHIQRTFALYTAKVPIPSAIKWQKV